jgi:predicted Zn-dependent peptidase
MFGTLVPRDGVSVDALADAYRAVLDDASKTALTDTELDRAKALLTSGWHRGVAAYSGRADKLSMHLTVLGSTDRLHTYLDELAAVTAEDVRAVAEAYLHPDNRITLTYLPTEEPTDALTDES